MFVIDSDLFKARPVKYVKRTGTPGHYKYWYKMPDGSVQAGDEAQQKEGRKEHTLRLLIARKHGHTSMTSEQISKETGYHQDSKPKEADIERYGLEEAKRKTAIHNINGHISGFKKVAKRKHESKENDWHIHGHDFSDEHIGESHGPAEAEDGPAEVRVRIGTFNLAHAERIGDYSIGQDEEGKWRVYHGPTDHSSSTGYDTRDGAKDYVENHVSLENRTRQREAEEGGRDELGRTPAQRTAEEATRAEAEAVGERARLKKIAKLEAKLKAVGITFDGPVSTSQSAPAEEENQYSDEAIARRRARREAEGVNLDGTPIRRSYELLIDDTFIELGETIMKSEKIQEELAKAELIAKIKAKKVMKAFRIRG